MSALIFIAFLIAVADGWVPPPSLGLVILIAGVLGYWAAKEEQGL